FDDALEGAVDDVVLAVACRLAREVEGAGDGAAGVADLDLLAARRIGAVLEEDAVAGVVDAGGDAGVGAVDLRDQVADGPDGVADVDPGARAGGVGDLDDAGAEADAAVEGGEERRGGD